MQNTAKLVSLSELGALLTLGGIAVVRQNSYAGALGSMILLKQIPEKIIKYFGDQHIKNCNLRYNKSGTGYTHSCHSGWSSFFLDLVRRPAHASNCSMINGGGDVSIKKSGFPSGHATVTSFIFTTFLIESVKRYKSKNSIPIALLIYSTILLLLIPLARTDLNCHSGKQVIAGLILGGVIAICYEKIESIWLIKYQRYADDKKKFYDMFVV